MKSWPELALTLINVAAGRAAADMVIKNGRWVNVHSGELDEKIHQHTETSPALTGGDVDADWESACSVGDEAPGGDNLTPDQNVVDDMGQALGVEYEDNEELTSEKKISDRDKHRWELDPESADDYDER